MVKKRVRPEPRVSGRRKAAIITGIAVFLIVAVLATSFFVWQNRHPKKEEAKPVETVERAVSGKNMESDKQDSLNSLTMLLRAADVSPTGANPKERLDALDKGDESVVTQEVKDAVHFAPEASGDYRKSTYQALITFATMIKTRSGANAIAAFSDTSWNMVHADPQTGTTYIPLDCYTGGGSYFSFEMVFVDGKWKLAPYNLVDSLRFSAAMQKQQQEQAQEPQQNQNAQQGGKR